ncbi:hypothetical protein CTEN210_07255 [Chaetoceros tenuissimus]|uniref:Tudor domain-containing protein n=1 Tax=Chaetoceros tenuissimus TaxID=426638 RepID=A0AAD3H5L5_9STRA|nr:hypothetical protein CTEN210_07255 [Chaetoceros tenuissimus]
MLQGTPEIGSRVEICDLDGIWSSAVVIDKSQEKEGDVQVTIKYDGWAHGWDEKLDMTSERLSKIYTHTARVKCLAILDFRKKKSNGKKLKIHFQLMEDGQERNLGIQNHQDAWPCILHTRVPRVESRYRESKAVKNLTEEIKAFVQPYRPDLLPVSLQNDWENGGFWQPTNCIKFFPFDPVTKKTLLDSGEFVEKQFRPGFRKALIASIEDKSTPGHFKHDWHPLYERRTLLREEYFPVEPPEGSDEINNPLVDFTDWRDELVLLSSLETIITQSPVAKKKEAKSKVTKKSVEKYVVGTRCRIEVWDLYEGKIINVPDTKDDFYKVRYTDDDEEELDLDEVHKYRVQFLNSKKKASEKKKKKYNLGIKIAKYFPNGDVVDGQIVDVLKDNYRVKYVDNTTKIIDMAKMREEVEAYKVANPKYVIPTAKTPSKSTSGKGKGKASTENQKKAKAKAESKKSKESVAKEAEASSKPIAQEEDDSKSSQKSKASTSKRTSPKTSKQAVAKEAKASSKPIAQEEDESKKPSKRVSPRRAKASTSKGLSPKKATATTPSNKKNPQKAKAASTRDKASSTALEITKGKDLFDDEKSEHFDSNSKEQSISNNDEVVSKVSAEDHGNLKKCDKTTDTGSGDDFKRGKENNDNDSRNLKSGEENTYTGTGFFTSEINQQSTSNTAQREILPSRDQKMETEGSIIQVLSACNSGQILNFDNSLISGSVLKPPFQPSSARPVLKLRRVSSAPAAICTARPSFTTTSNHDRILSTAAHNKNGVLQPHLSAGALQKRSPTRKIGRQQITAAANHVSTIEQQDQALLERPQAHPVILNPPPINQPRPPVPEVCIPVNQVEHQSNHEEREEELDEASRGNEDEQQHSMVQEPEAAPIQEQKNEPEVVQVQERINQGVAAQDSDASDSESESDESSDESTNIAKEPHVHVAARNG